MGRILFRPLQLDMPENELPGETTQFIQRMDGELLGWDQPAARLREALDYDHFRLYAQPIAVPGAVRRTSRWPKCWCGCAKRRRTCCRRAISCPRSSITG